MNVLSLFDGMSCGQLALNRAGINYDNYFASEIDKYAITVTMNNFHRTIQLGDIRNIKGSDLPKIDLLIGGSPCQGFSFAGKQLNFEDPRSKLFFEYVRLLKETNPKYFLLENVRMKRESQDVISRYLGVEPIMIDSALVSAQSRKRLYWTNIPNITQPVDKGFVLADILDNVTDANYDLPEIWQDWWVQEDRPLIEDNKFIHVLGRTSRYASKWVVLGTQGKSNVLRSATGGSQKKVVPINNVLRKLTPIEWERLQTVPDNYTAGVSNSQRYSMLGNGWTIDVISHIFNFMELAQEVKAAA